MSHDAVRRYHYRGIIGVWLTTVTVWLFSREGVAKSPCRCGSGGGIYRWLDYFGIASMKITMQRWGEWLRRGLRKAYWNVPEVRC